MKRHTSMLAIAMVTAAVSLWSSNRGESGEWSQTFDRLSAEFTIENPGPAVAPTYYVVGLPDRSVDPVLKSHGLTWNGVRLAEEMLSESVLILRPNGTGNWGYQITRRAGYGDGTARYVLIASLDGFQPQTVDVTIQQGTHRVYDMGTRRDVTDELKAIELAPGEGKVLLVGTPADFDADCRLINTER